LWSVMVLSSQGEIASDMKSLMEVFTKVKAATMPHLYHVSRTMPMNTVLSEGPQDMNLVSSRPMSLKTETTMTSQTIRKQTARRLSSKTRSMQSRRHIFARRGSGRVLYLALTQIQKNP
jgi:hypothetical protein